MSSVVELEVDGVDEDESTGGVMPTDLDMKSIEFEFGPRLRGL